MVVNFQFRLLENDEHLGEFPSVRSLSAHKLWPTCCVRISPGLCASDVAELEEDEVIVNGLSNGSESPT